MNRIGTDAEKAQGKMPRFRFQRIGVLDEVTVEAESAEAAEAAIRAEDIVSKGQGEFRLTRIEEVTPQFTGYVLETSRDVIEEKRI